jgi:hypothetical protein
MITSVEGPGCVGQNHTAAWVVVVYKPYKAGTYSNRADQRYVSSLNKCTMIPIKTPVGSGIRISGIMEGRFATYGLAPQVNDGPGCFNVEAYSVGLATGPVPAISLQPGEDFYNPQDPNNIINDQGYGLWWARHSIRSSQLLGLKWWVVDIEAVRYREQSTIRTQGCSPTQGAMY